MTNSSEYTPSKVWTWNYTNSGRFATINRPIAGSTHDKELPVGRRSGRVFDRLAIGGEDADFQRTFDAHSVAFREVHEFGLHGFGEGHELEPTCAIAGLPRSVAVVNGLPDFDIRCSGALKRTPVAPPRFFVAALADANRRAKAQRSENY